MKINARCEIAGCRSKILMESYSGNKLINICKAHLLMSLRGFSRDMCKVIERSIENIYKGGL